MEYNISNRMSKMRGSAIREIFKYTSDPSVISLAGGNPAPELFPNEQLAEIAKEMLINEPVLSLQYGISEGYVPLRNAIKERLKRIENIGTEDDELIVVSGGQQGIELSIKVFMNEGDTVIVEEPSFIGATNAFRSYGANLVGVPVESDGMNIEILEQKLKENKNVRIIYTIPTFQNPMGVTMSIEKRKQVYELAKKYGVLILEDNPYGELTFDGVKTPTIKSMDTDGIVIYSGSFSKILAPGLRLGYLCANKQIIQKIVIAKQVSDVHTAMLPQLLASEYLKRYSIDDAIVKMRENYAHKCSTMLNAIEEYFPKDTYFTRPGGGLFIWCDLGHGVDTFELSKKAIENKVAYVPGNTFMTDMDKPCSTLRLNYSTMSDEKIIEGIKRLGTVFADAIK
ncbi:MAG: PLP-dependent aminotransferase family protein [Clostridiales bacterium]|nr:PLP-dependent aminotransferase family protein [Candidatus Equinaster intestinalis]